MMEKRYLEDGLEIGDFRLTFSEEGKNGEVSDSLLPEAADTCKTLSF